ncbi:MAG: amidohydrolase family protein, partial [Planctomycetes bacterium]|nr:amidohydrolase family protein [Planctomycetota bacterium]
MHANRLILSLAAGLTLFGFAPESARGAPPSTKPVEGLRENTPDVHALVGGRIIVAPGRVIEEGTVVVSAGVIVDVGAEVTVPPDARIWDLAGKTVYPGLIDSYSPASVPSVSTTRGAPHWNQAVQPQRDAARGYRVDESLNSTLRSQGITCRLIVPDSGVIRGTSALVTTGDGPAREAVVVDRVALHVRLSINRKGDDRGTYPNSPMGAVALARQAMYDADWHRRAWQTYRSDPARPRPERNEALERLGDYVDGDKLVILEAQNEQSFLRADRFAREFAVRAMVRGSGREYCRLEAIRATGRPVIVPLEFPKPPDVGTPEAALGVSLSRLMHWDIAPENPARLAEAGVPIALSGDGLKSPKEFLKAVRTAVRRGLDADAALEALTIQPARLFGASDRLGTLDVGKAAHLVVADGDLFAEKTRVLQTWVDGRQYEVVDDPLVDVRGAWRVTLPSDRKKRLILTVSGKPGKLEGTMRLDRKEAKDTKLTLVGLRDARFGCTFDGRSLESEGMVQLSAVVSVSADGKTTWLGNLHWPDGGLSAIDVKPVEPPADEEQDEEKADEEKESESPTDAAASFAVNYPLGAFGRAAPPEQPEVVVFKGATVWTCEEAGVLEGASVMIGAGKIMAVGNDLRVPPDAVVVDCRGKHLTPGVIDSHSHMATDGGVNESTQAITSEVRIADFLNPADVAIYRQLAGGVTTSHVMHGSANPIGGQDQVIKLRWGAIDEELKFAEAPTPLKMALGENVKQSNWGDEYTTRYPQTRMGVVEIIRDAFQAAKEYQGSWDEWRRTRRGLPPRRDLELDALVDILEERSWIHCHAYRQDEILALLRTLEDLGIRAGTLHHILEGYKVA